MELNRRKLYNTVTNTETELKALSTPLEIDLLGISVIRVECLLLNAFHSTSITEHNFLQMESLESLSRCCGYNIILLVNFGK